MAVNGTVCWPSLPLENDDLDAHLMLVWKTYFKLKVLKKRGVVIVNGNDLDISSVVAVAR